MLHLFQFKGVTVAKNSVWEASQVNLQVMLTVPYSQLDKFHSIESINNNIVLLTTNDDDDTHSCNAGLASHT